MKLFALLVLYKGDPAAHVLKGAYDLSSFSFFQRGSVQGGFNSLSLSGPSLHLLFLMTEFITFTSKILAERTSIASRQSVKEAEYMCHIYVRSDSLVGVCLSDHEYPNRVAHTLITKILDDFTAQVPRSQWPAGTEVAGFSGPLDVHLKKYQDPNSADPMTKVQNELDETKIILHNTIQAVLERGEKLDDLVEKSEGLSLQSKTFYKTAKKTNSCCASWS
jgi:synaptobrevin family protein YKT6